MLNVSIDQAASLAQLVEQLICNQQVNGSSPLAGSMIINELWKFLVNLVSHTFTLPTQ